MYKVLEQFADLQDDNRVYNPGDEFPREGVLVNQARLDELAGTSNKLGKPLIVKVETPSQKGNGGAETAKKPSKKKSAKK